MPNDLLQKTDSNQGTASDPRVSAWVSANAGTGKTTVLVRRVLRLLLHRDAGGIFTRPETILCLTYTKAAAGEMENRLFRELADWAILDDAELHAKLEKLLAAPPDGAQMMRARQLFARTLDARGGLKIYTIHAFCERLLHRFPLEAGIASGFAVMDDLERRALLEAAIEHVLDRASRVDDPLFDALRHVIASAGEDTFRDIVEAVLGQRERLRAIIRHHDESDFAQAERRAIARVFNVPDNATETGLAAAMADVLDPDTIRTAIAVLEGGQKTDLAFAQALRNALASPTPEQRSAALQAHFMTQAGSARSRLCTNAVREAHPGLTARLDSAQGDFCQLAAQLAGLRVADASGALVALADAIFNEYERLKQARARLDYDDLIERTATLLTRADGAAAWVLYKLDYGIGHVLVDEAQDTSPPQWQVIGALIDEFFAGEGIPRPARTVFAVGDEKQSIYSFQGADPAEFSGQGQILRRKATNAGLAFEKVPLTISFRSTEAVLAQVDKVFERDEAKAGLVFEGDYEIHQAVRAGEAGLVELWETERLEKGEEVHPFRPHHEQQQGRAPADRVAARIAGTIRGWLDGGEELVAKRRAVTPGDILILVPRRGNFTRAMIRELKARGIPVAGADRMVLTEQLGVMDLMALGDFLLLTEDDLSLATVLKSPLFGFDDDDLFRIAWQRKGSLWRALREHGGTNPRFAAAAERLSRWLGRADFEPPYEFFARLLEERDGAGTLRHRMIARLGAEAGDAIDEFLNLALDHERDAPPSLQGFLESVRVSAAEVKRDMEQGRDEVRVMTVYGAKGLEADIVFLPDTCSIPRGQGGATLLDVPRKGAPPNAPDHIVWVPPGTMELTPVAEAKERRKTQDHHEYHRLLYVAMTRARDRLYVCGWEGARSRETGCWYDLISEGLKDHMEALEDAEGRSVWRHESGGPGRDLPGAAAGESASPAGLPDWALRPAAHEAPLALAAPSTLGADSEAAIAEQPVLSPDKLTDNARFLRGNLVHDLLQHLPALAADDWETRARAYVEARGTDLDPQVRDEVVDETLAILRDPQFAPLFGPESLPEVPLAARIDRAPVRGAPLEIAGRIDRLAVIDDAVLIVDYKTNRPPPETPEQVAPGYKRQLAAYAHAIRGLFPGKAVRAALLWTDGPRLMEIPEDQLAEAEAAITGRSSS